ncbi:hypothetical protein NADE_008653 [Nannochloris sp. 'desiccata']|nr:hypothetical protein KSW81_002099 [Chlorella desiccata (nom. nud.)]KAH7623836.1 hypothetical protein NADE_008653 [Chlorella desiccata (nom. nud.)]
MQEFKSFEELEQAYKALKQEVALLEQEWRESGVLEEVNSIETEFLEEQTAKELGVAGVTVLGVGTLHKILKLIFTPKAAAPLIGGVWVLGGAFILFHFTGSTAAGWALMTQRNARRKRVLHRKLEAIQRHFDSLTVDSELNVPPTTEQRQTEDIIEAEDASIRRNSPSNSTGSSAELVEAPSAEDDPEGRAGGVAGGTSTSSTSKTAESGGYSLESWKKYASLGGIRKKDS